MAAIAGVYMLQDTQNVDDMAAIWKPILEHVAVTWPQALRIHNNTAFPSWLSWYSEHFDTDSAGLNTYVGSHLVDAESLTDPKAIGQAWKQFSILGTGNAYLVAGKGVREAKPRGGGNAVVPAWRKTLVHASKSPIRKSRPRCSTSSEQVRTDVCGAPLTANGVSFKPLNATARKEAETNLNYAVDALRKLAPNMGAYVNEVSRLHTPWQSIHKTRC